MDAERFSDIFSRLHANLRRMALRIVGNEAEAADAVQDAFCSLWCRRQSVADDGKIEGMMTVSVRNRCLSEIRQRSKYPSGSLDEDFSGSGSGSASVEAASESPEDIFAEVEQLMESYLSERDRRILILRDQYGWDFEDIAMEMEMTASAVRMALSRARRGVLRAYKDRNGSHEN